MKGHSPAIVAALFAVVLGVLGSLSPLWTAVADGLGVSSWVVGGLLILGSLLGLVVALPDARGDGSGRGDASEDGTTRSTWDLIPSRQYDGVYADSGGLTRGEQEASLEEIHQQADDISREYRRR